MQKNDGFVIKGAFILAIGALLTKVIGAIYRVPLTNVLGAEGIGIYQAVFPIYVLLLDFSGTAVPSAISKIISGYKKEDKNQYALRILKSSIKLFSLIGLIGFLVMFLSSFPLSIAQGNKNAYIGYMLLSPSVIIVAIISCYRGYFQGLKNVTPTAVSQVIEQIIKLAFGLTLANMFLPNISLAVGGATLGVTISEAVALAYLFIKHKKSLKGLDSFKISTHKSDVKLILKNSIPITIIGVAIPLIHVINSFLIVNILSTYTDRATALYGLFSGAAHTVISLPVSVCFGISTVTIPVVSGATDKESAKTSGAKTMFLTLIVSIIAAIAVYSFAPIIVKILFSSFDKTDMLITVNLIKTMSFNIVFLSLLQTENAVLIGMGRQTYPIIGLSVGIMVNAMLNLILLKDPTLNIYASAISLFACYFLACLINLIMISFIKVNDAVKEIKRREYAN